MNTITVMENNPTFITLQSMKSDHENSEYIARMIASWVYGRSCLPDYLGLDSADEFLKMIHFFFPGYYVSPIKDSGQPRDPQRQDEFEVLSGMLLSHRSAKDDTEIWLSKIIAAGSMGMDHLWQDLGLWSRKDISFLLDHNFHDLFAKNTKDMKWKKFFYKQFCIQEGINTCKAPSCEVCDDYDKCFGPEE